MINGQPSPAAIIFAICYSPTAIFVIAVLGTLLIFGITIYYIIPFRSVMPFMAGSARVVFASCTALPKDLPTDGIMWGDVSDEWGRLAGFGENAKGIQLGEIYPERFKRAPSHTTGDRPLTAHSFRPYSSDLRNSSTTTIESRYSTTEERFGDVAELVPSRTRPPLTTRRFSRTPSYRSYVSTTTLPPYTERQTPDIIRNASDASRANRSPLQTRRPVEDSELGDGYNLGGLRPQRISLSDLDTEDGEGRFDFNRPVTESPAIIDESDNDVEWVGWGINPGEGHDSDSDNDTVKQPEWHGWEGSATHDERVHEDDETALVNKEWRGWGV